MLFSLLSELPIRRRYAEFGGIPRASRRCRIERVTRCGPKITTLIVSSGRGCTNHNDGVAFVKLLTMKAHINTAYKRIIHERNIIFILYTFHKRFSLCYLWSCFQLQRLYKKIWINKLILFHLLMVSDCRYFMTVP